MQMFQAFNFRVEIRLPESSHPLCEASFSECDGLEVTREVKSIREGGNNSTHLRLPGGVSYGQVTLKRGMTRGFDLWKWFDQSVSSPALRASIDVVMLTAAREEAVRFTLTRARTVCTLRHQLHLQELRFFLTDLILQRSRDEEVSFVREEFLASHDVVLRVTLDRAVSLHVIGQTMRVETFRVEQVAGVIGVAHDRHAHAREDHRGV